MTTITVRVTCNTGMNNSNVRRIVKKTVLFWEKKVPEAVVSAEYVDKLITCPHGHENPNYFYLEVFEGGKVAYAAMMKYDPKHTLEATA